MGVLDRFEAAYVEVSSDRATRRELFELAVGSLLFVVVAAVLADYFVSRRAAAIVAGVLGVVFLVTLASQTYWAVFGRSDYAESETQTK